MTTTHVPEIALVGCPNAGKTALFNALTGSRQKVANYAGVTVERKEGAFVTPGGKSVKVLDLPGTYSLRGRSPDEIVTRDVVLGLQKGEAIPDAVVCVADATNLRLVLRLVIELMSVGRPMVLALNMMDQVEKQGGRIDAARLSAELGIPVVPIVAIRKGGITELLEAIDRMPLEAADPRPHGWREPNAEEIRATHATATRILKDCAFHPGDEKLTRRLDAVLLHPVWGVLVLLAVLFLMFQAVFTWAAPAMDAIEAMINGLGRMVGEVLPDGMLRSLIVDGVIAGVGAVLVFLPQIVILFFFIILLEDFGYMARAAFLMDRLMAGTGLHGRAFIPLLSSFACAIPGIMAARVIENRRDRIATIMVAPLMTCSARLPVYTLIIAAFIPEEARVFGFGLQGLTMFALFATGIVSALLVAFVMKKLIWKEEPEPFIMELPDYKWPVPRNVAIGLWIRAGAFLRRAGTIILAIMILIWFLSSFPAPPDGATGPAIDWSWAGRLGHFLEPLFAPIGFNWQIVLALIPGMAAREVAVGVLGTVYALSATGDEVGEALKPILTAQWPLSTALSFLVWYVFAPQCASTLAVVRRETNSWIWPAVQFAYMGTLAYAASFATYHLVEALTR
ncbi:ferrous iron transport protein B [Pinisolibacter aquiterrae]|uniref:ferrous iron transport protein B n=1 Tax=Pinisolibacter aquiterrae TaxID=2815579 RepID=UPI001C3C6614|nr:ferrous iron transport protein B [Pinisolibacter aquiterrae]MBV5266226.1 ferrous iron transport protein B [Pinisolibacter aquiterrae]MCC8236314.1 ferrous iron transport protein B [Pinisolibacter aquiterrae]